ncbi:MAG: leucine-rich repeat domain-containing protein [Bacilli bacterium]
MKKKIFTNGLKIMRTNVIKILLVFSLVFTVTNSKILDHKKSEINAVESDGVGKKISAVFPDSNFAQGVLEQINSSSEFSGLTVDDTLTQEMVNVVTKLSLQSKNISDISGIESLVKLKEVNFRKNKIMSIPENISNLSELEIFNITGNLVTNLPNSIVELKSLKDLNVSSNKLTSLPDDIGDLTSLVTLTFSNNIFMYQNANQITKLPDSLGNLSNLENLFGSDNKLTELPDSIGNLKNLEIISLSDNNLSELPNSIGDCESIKDLIIGANPSLVDLPASMSKLKNIEELNIHSGEFTEIPDVVFEMTSLKDILFSNNPITEIPEEIENLTNLTKLTVDENKLKSLPKTLVNLPNLTRLDIRFNEIRTLSEELMNFMKTNMTDLNVSPQRAQVDMYLPNSYELGTDVDVAGFPILNELHNYSGEGSPFTYTLKLPDGTINDITSEVYPFETGTDFTLAGDYFNTGGVYQVFATTNEGHFFYSSSDRYKTEYTWNIIIDKEPLLEVVPFTELPLGNNGNEFDPKLGIIEVKDDFDDVSVDDVIISGDVVDVNKAGIYIVDYALDDSSLQSSTATASQVVLVNDGNYVVDGNYIINASDFEINLSEVNKITSEDIVKLSKVNVFNIEEAKYIEKPEIRVDSEIENKIGTYDVTLTYNPSIVVQAKVVSNDSVEGNDNLPKTGMNNDIVIAMTLMLVVFGFARIRKVLCDRK